MAPELEGFDLTGPKQLAVVDWRNNHHCRAVAASLVQGAYNSKRNPQKSQDPKVQRSRWWSFFHFEVKRVLIDDKDSSIYGVVYEFKHTNPNNLPECAPKCVIAFRGTILKSRSAKQDMKLNIKLLTAELHKDNSRFKPALDAVKEVVQEAEPANIWLAGHSLGSAIAMLVGKSMAQEKYLKTFLFNPPFLRSSQRISTVHVWRM
ncbi:GDSL esterase/lipase At4g10955-like [Vitis riparia]|uniref:GDSL esterase/lipase At4g10955-like n=1 Tax=Vitis riparia TaxID=96939 RepID=UPI00155A3D2C|nr:GDSL esterase/lipase At4g10955-like [Vitis riparia]XP_034711552.1 GDSL esterase/lipase At4g10955-like [Vitis riparia]